MLVAKLYHCIDILSLILA